MGLYDDHHTGIHGNKLKPVLPTGIAARFRYVSLMVGLYLPDKCIGFQERRQRLDPEVRELDYGGRMLMWERKDVAVDRRMTVTRFLISAAINFGLAAQHTEFDRTLIDKFGDEPNTYAMPLMSRLVELTTRVTGLHESYSASKSEGLLPPQAPKTAKQLLVENIERYETERVRNQSDGFESVAVLLQKSLVQAHRQAS